MARFYVSIGGYMQVPLALQKKTWLNVVQPIIVRQNLFVYSYICNDDDGDDDEMRMVCFDCTPQGITAPTINSTDYANIYNFKKYNDDNLQQMPLIDLLKVPSINR